MTTKSNTNTASKKYYLTKKGIVTRLFSNQKLGSTKRGHAKPSYTKGELSNWLFSNKKFDVIYEEWVKSGYLKTMRPSVDRIDDTKGYSFDNIQLMTWGENNNKAYRDQMYGTKFDGQRRVIKISISGDEICGYVSISEAIRRNPRASKVSECCSGIRKTAGGFRWRYA